MTDDICGLTVLCLTGLAIILIGFSQLMTWARCRELQAQLRLLDELNSQHDTQPWADSARHAQGERA